MLIIFQHRPTRIDQMQREISPCSTSLSIVEVENKSHPRPTNFLDCKDDFHIPNFVFLNHMAMVLTTFGKGSQNLSNTEVYMYSPLALGQACGKYWSHLLMLSGSMSGSSIGSRRSSVFSYLLSLCGNTVKCMSASTMLVMNDSKCPNMVAMGSASFSGIGMHSMAQKTNG